MLQIYEVVSRAVALTCHSAWSMYFGETSFFIIVVWTIRFLKSHHIICSKVICGGGIDLSGKGSAALSLRKH